MLKDPDLRKKYDLYGEEGLNGANKQQNYHSWNYYRDDFGIYDDDPQVVTLNRHDYGNSKIICVNSFLCNPYRFHRYGFGENFVILYFFSSQTTALLIPKKYGSSISTRRCAATAITWRRFGEKLPKISRASSESAPSIAKTIGNSVINWEFSLIPPCYFIQRYNQKFEKLKIKKLF